MSTLRPLVIQTGADWGWVLDLTASGQALVVDHPVLEMRRDINPQGQFLARFDTTGDANGLITINAPGMWTLSMTRQATSALPYGRGFWDSFGYISGKVCPLGSGAVEIRPRVTAVTG